MKFNWRDNETFVSHWMLWDIDIAKAISETPEFNDGMKTVAKVTVNGIELSFEAVERYMHETYDRTIKAAEAKFADIEAAVDARAREFLKEQAQSVLDKLDDLSDALRGIDDIIVPYWERNKS